MAFKHRKLFPVKNETIEDCSVFCDPSCPYKYNCFPIPDPTLIYPPPQPPPPSLNKSHKDQPISPFVIIIITLLSSLFLLISYYAIIVKHCTRSNTPPSRQDSADEEQQRLDENQGPVIDHPIWLITTVGLQQSIINSITVCKYKKGEGLIEGTDCSVCLSEFREDETLRLLPKCNHAFHTHCIDTWLRSHTNCPLCRARIVSDTVNSNSASTERNLQSLSVNEETQMGNYQGDGELSDNQVRNSTGVGENRAETEDVCEQQQQVDDGDIRRSKEGVNSDNGSNGFSQVVQNSVGNHQNMVDEVQQLRRSISMDSSSTTSISLGLATFPSHGEASDNLLKLDVSKFDSDVLQEHDGNNSRVSQSIGSTSSTEETLENSSVSMKRSLSYGGGRSFWPRHNQCRNSILPL